MVIHFFQSFYLSVFLSVSLSLSGAPGKCMQLLLYMQLCLAPDRVMWLTQDTYLQENYLRHLWDTKVGISHDLMAQTMPCKIQIHLNTWPWHCIFLLLFRFRIGYQRGSQRWSYKDQRIKEPSVLKAVGLTRCFVVRPNSACL